MKTLSVQQPEASLICIGIQDIENRSWRPKKAPGRILIHASSKKVPKNYDNVFFPSTEISVVSNLKNFGILPDYEDMPVSAIIGYVNVVDFTTDSDSIWALDGAIHWQLKDAYLFDEPIKNVKGCPNLFDYPLDENNLPPAHKVEMQLPQIENEKLIVHIGSSIWEYLYELHEAYIINLKDPYVIDRICVNDSYDLRPVSSIRFIYGDESIEFEVEDYGSDTSKDSKDYHTVNNYVLWAYAIYMLGERIE